MNVCNNTHSAEYTIAILTVGPMTLGLRNKHFQTKRWSTLRLLDSLKSSNNPDGWRYSHGKWIVHKLFTHQVTVFLEWVCFCQAPPTYMINFPMNSVFVVAKCTIQKKLWCNPQVCQHLCLGVKAPKLPSKALLAFRSYNDYTRPP